MEVCNPEKDAKPWDRQKANLRIRFKPQALPARGHSSLAGGQDPDTEGQGLWEAGTAEGAHAQVTRRGELEPPDISAPRWSKRPCVRTSSGPRTHARTLCGLYRFRFRRVLGTPFFYSWNTGRPEDKLLYISVRVLPFGNPQSDEKAGQEGCSATSGTQMTTSLWLLLQGVAGPLEALRFCPGRLTGVGLFARDLSEKGRPSQGLLRVPFAGPET